MTHNETPLLEWNRGIVGETIELLEKVELDIADAKSRLRGFLNVNPGGQSVLSANEKAAPVQCPAERGAA